MLRIAQRCGLGALLLVAAVGCSGSDESSPTSPVTEASVVSTDSTASTSTAPGDTVPLPPVDADAGAATVAFLAGPGAPLVALASVAATLSSAATPDCQAALDQLSAGPSPEDLAAIAADTPDPVLAGAFNGLVLVTDEFVTRCIKDGSVPADVDQRLDEASALVARRTADLA